MSYSNSHSSATGVGRVAGSSTYCFRTPPSPTPCRLGILLNANWNGMHMFNFYPIEGGFQPRNCMQRKKPPKKVSLFIPCLVEHFLPQVGEATARVLSRAGVEILYPKGQTCCGQMQFKTGHRRDARKMARHFFEVFEGAEIIVAPSGSCVGMVRKHYPELFQDDPSWLERVTALGRKTFELTEFLVNILGTVDLGAVWPGKAVYHDSCQLSRALGVRQQPRTLLSRVRQLEVLDWERQETCCGFGGVFSLEFPDISDKMVEDKAKAAVRSGAEILITAEPSCLMNIGGYLEKQGGKIKAVHIAEVLAHGDGQSWR
jgi:L-lactate dehydrogenase complex protein LldE